MWSLEDAKKDISPRQFTAVIRLAKLSGKRATVTYEVVTEDPETEQLLEKAITVQLTSLLSQDKEKLRIAAGQVPAPKPKESKDPGERFASQFLEEPVLIMTGDDWAYSVAIVANFKGNKSVRVAKGKIVGNYYTDPKTGEAVIRPNDPKNPIKQQSHLNVYSLQEWESLQEPVITRLNALRVSK